jgi:site-specific DNA-cytosine methylase
MKVLSLFDGMSCGQIALNRIGITPEKYYASEIDKHAIRITMSNYPDTIQLGDVTKWREWDIDWASIDLLIGGSPCQGFSFAGKQLAFDDPRSKLFFVYVDILNHIRSVNPSVKFMLENVKMKKEHLAVISETLGVEPVFINSALVSAQNRQRYYWCNWHVEQPEDKGVTLSSVLNLPTNIFKIYQKDKPHKSRPSNTKASCLTGAANAAGNHSQMDVVVMNDTEIPLTSTGRIDIHATPYVFRYSVMTCEKLQTVPVGYTSAVSNSQAYKALINGWTVDVIAHIFNALV